LKLDFYPFGEQKQRLAQLLKLRESPFIREFDADGIAFRQIEYIERYVAFRDLNCQSVVIERHYIDRDYMEDYSIFYSKNLHPYGNSCQRVHFFNIDPQEVKQKLTDLLRFGKQNGEEKYRQAAVEFSEKHYLGFSVIKPLGGCPVGRTVLRTYSNEAEEGRNRLFLAIRPYKVHLLGVELVVRGLAFQQQDLGVSACATTALWSALHKVRDFEDIGSATPAQITMRATQHTLPFGRSMPSSEGLSID
jgi:hypothetical protein